MAEILLGFNILVAWLFGYRLINVNYDQEGKAGYIMDGLVFSFNIAAITTYYF
jgi:hypothetical protein